MLKTIVNLWKSGSIMNDVMEQLGRMVGDAEYVVNHAWEVCAGQAIAEKVDPLIKGRDKEINRAERTIRRLVVQHLNINPGQDVSGCLAIMLVSKDVERIGDHGRNILQVAVRAQSPVSEFKFYGELSVVHAELAKLLPMLQRALVESNTDLARQTLDLYQALKKQSKEIGRALYDADMTTREAVATTLLWRFMRRINSHIGNAASGVLFPVENIDFVSRGLKEEDKDR